MKQGHPWLFATVGIFAAGSASAQTASTAQQIGKLQDQVEVLQREIQRIKAKVAKAESNAQPAVAATPTSAAMGKVAAVPPTAIAAMSPGNRPSICTPDQLNCIALTSRLHLDVGGYNYRPATAKTSPQELDDGVNARRARIGVIGKFMGDWEYSLVYDFGGSADGFGGLAPGSLPGGGTSGIEQAWLSYIGFKGVAIEGGYMDSLYTLDNATSSNDIMFMERASSSVIANNIAASDFRSQGGIRGYDDWIWAGAYFTGPVSGTIHSDSITKTSAPQLAGITTFGQSEQYGGFGRLTFQALQGPGYSVHIGGDVEFLLSPPVGPASPTAIASRTLTLSDHPELRIDPTTILSTGPIANVSHAQVYSAEAAAGLRPFFFQGEYFWFKVEREFGLPSLNFTGGYAEASWTITGESRKYIPTTGAYSGIIPFNPVNPSGTGWAPGKLPVATAS
jgi:phosphate-selective porin OprO/OprP